MTLRTIKQETDATASSTGSWTVASLATNSGGAAKFATSGSTFTFTLPANHGWTGGALLGYGYSNGTTNASIAVDGVTVQSPWSMRFGTLNDAKYALPRVLSLPFALNPAKGSVQTVVLTAGATGVTWIDGIELYTAAAQVAGRLTSTGHSMLYGVTDQNTLGPRTGRHSALFATYLGQTGYMGQTTWTDDNQAVPSEDLTNGSYKSGLAGGPNSGPLYTQFANDQYYNNTAIFTPGWMRLEAGDTWPSPAPALGTALMTTNAQYMAGVPQWWARAFPVGLFFHNVNDDGLTNVYDAGAAIGIGPPNPRDAAADTAAPAAGAGYGLARFLQRFREALIRPMLAITPAPRIYVIGMPNEGNGGTNTFAALMAQYDAGMQAVIAESWVQNVYFVSPQARMTGFPSNVSGTDFHPNADGHQAIHEAIKFAHAALERRVTTTPNH